MNARFCSLLLFVSGLALTSLTAQAAQFVLFDVTFPFTKQDADNAKPSQSHYYVTDDKLNPKRPVDWTGPVDYRNGTVHIRFEVLEKPPGGAPTTWSICYIPNKGHYGCTGTDIYKEKGVYEKDVPMKSFWNNNLIDWTGGIKRMDLVMKDDSGGSGHIHKRKDPERYLPTKVRFTLIQVSAGSKYDPSLVPGLPKKSDKKDGKQSKQTTAPDVIVAKTEAAVPCCGEIIKK